MIESQFAELQAVVQRVKKEVMEVLESEEKQSLKQAEGIRAHLEQRCAELKKTQGQVEKISKNKNEVDFLQVMWGQSIMIHLGSICYTSGEVGTKPGPETIDRQPGRRLVPVF